MTEFIARYAVFFATLWITSIVVGIYVRAINERVVYVRDLIFACIFGPLWMFFQVGHMDAILWKGRDRK